MYKEYITGNSSRMKTRKFTILNYLYGENSRFIKVDNFIRPQIFVTSSNIL